MNEYYAMFASAESGKNGDVTYTVQFRFMATSDERARDIFNKWLCEQVLADARPRYSLVRGVR